MKIGKNIITPRWGDISIWKNKSFEYQFEGPHFAEDSVECNLCWTRRTDHAGISFTFGIKYLFWLNLNIHDNRHWNKETNSWQTYDEFKK